MGRHALAFLLVLGFVGAQVQPKGAIPAVAGHAREMPTHDSEQTPPLSSPGAASIAAGPVFCADWYTKTVDAAASGGLGGLVQPAPRTDSIVAARAVAPCAGTLLSQGIRLQI